MMIYSRFKGATGKHGWRISRRLRQALKSHLARTKRKRRRAAYTSPGAWHWGRVRHGVTAPPRYTKAHHNKQPVRNRLSSHSWR